MANTTSTFGFNDPLYLHPSDAPDTSLVVDLLIGSENYSIWSRAMKIALQAKNKLGFINGTCRKPAANSPTLYQWERCNAVVLSWIFSSVSKEIFCGLVYANDASSVWADLKERFDKICGSRIYAIHRDIVRLSQGTTTISVYFSKLKQLWDELASLITSPSCDCPNSRAYAEHEQQQRLIQFLMGLNDNYSSIRSQILLMNPLPSVSQAYSLICQEEAHRNVLVFQQISDAPTTAFYSSSSKQSEIVKCDHCSIPGHTKDYCFRLIGYPPGHKLHKKFPQNKGCKLTSKNTRAFAHNLVSEASKPTAESQSPTSAGVQFTSTQYAQILRLLENSTINSPPSANLAGMATSLLSISDSNEWILDSGANAHISGTSTGLQNLQPCISAAGSELLTGKIMGIDKLKDGLYYLTSPSPPKSTTDSTPYINTSPCNSITPNSRSFASCNVSSPLNNTIDLWHKRMSGLIMVLNSLTLSAMISSLLLASSIRVHAHTHPNKMGLLNVNTDIYSTWLEPLHFKVLFLTYIGVNVYCTAVYLINRTPTPLLANKTPYEVIFKKAPTFDHIKVLGCLCYATNLRPSHKFDVRAVPYVFLGFPPHQKGYKLLNPSTNQFIVSRDVIFHEDIFPFAASTQSSATSSPWPSMNSDIHDDDVSNPTSTIPPINPTSHISPPIPPKRSSRQSKPPIWTKDFICSTLTTSSPATIPYDLSKYLSYNHISPSHQSFLASISQLTEPTSYKEASADPR
ncbi:uncharacterized protein LOC142504488 [Primulina tabacum]|uniref:uncharacterized protein LOC142504488 n=1 Tax=Primulina tabacum TaxID=48773 RepID=UPI003F59500A